MMWDNIEKKFQNYHESQIIFSYIVFEWWNSFRIFQQSTKHLVFLHAITYKNPIAYKFIFGRKKKIKSFKWLKSRAQAYAQHIFFFFFFKWTLEKYFDFKISLSAGCMRAYVCQVNILTQTVRCDYYIWHVF